MMDHPPEPLRRVPRWLALLVTLLLLIQVGGLWRSLRQPAGFVAADGLWSVTWALACALMLLILLRGTAPARQRTLWALALVIAYAALSGLRLALFAQADYDRGRLPFLALALGVIIVGFSARWLSIWRRRP